MNWGKSYVTVLVSLLGVTIPEVMPSNKPRSTLMKVQDEKTESESADTAAMLMILFIVCFIYAFFSISEGSMPRSFILLMNWGASFSRKSLRCCSRIISRAGAATK